MTFHVETTLRNSDGLKAYAKAANTPGSLYYRRWLGPSAIADSFGTPAAQYAAAAAFFRSYGMHVKTWPMRTSLTVTAQQKQIEAALGTRLAVFTLRGSRFYGIGQSMSVPSSVSIGSVSAITNAHLLRSSLIPGGPSQPVSTGFSNARVNGASPQMLAGAYDLNTAYARGYTGKGINLGIVGTGPIAAGDVPAYKTLFGLKGSSTVAQVTVSIDGDTAPPPTTGPCTAGTSTAPTATATPKTSKRNSTRSRPPASHPTRTCCSISDITRRTIRKASARPTMRSIRPSWITGSTFFRCHTARARRSR